ncbi:ATP-binding protein [Candidatus Manganitrophus noduliformans]|uniref:AAA family ATPase n=1 Tax=Candidatus Manganitrophus noduliformans TaxID=2606439 RepID=A0A7X6DSI0_9BACT|nr:AAA family ATPase [Candidatus Manganitrophus noduliformans]NKE72597.1 AAA family ATPase [Candidatus Manganitrophus noduliformans]
MLLLAIDLYGIEPFHKPTRISLKPGLNLVFGANGAGKTTVRRVLSSLLLGNDLKGIRFVENQPAQAAVILQGRDKGTYRITADYQKGLFNLSKLDASGQKSLLEKDRRKITAWVCEQAGGMQEEDLSSLFLIDRLQFPSAASHGNGPGTQRSGLSSGAPGPVPKKTEFPSFQIPDNEQPVLTPEQRAERQNQIKEIQRKLDEMAKVEETLLNARDRISVSKRRLNQSRELDSEAAQIQDAETKKYAAFAGIETVRPDLIKQYEAAAQNKQTELTQLEEQKEEIQANLANMGETDLFQDQKLRIGIVVTVCSFLLPLFVTLQGPFRYLFPIGVLAGIGLSLFAYLQSTGRAAAKKALEKKMTGFNEKANSLQRKFDKEHKEITELLAKTGCKEIQEFKDRQRAYQQHLQRKREVTEKREALLKGETVEEIALTIQEDEKEAKILEEKFQGYSGLTEELYRLEESLRHSEPAKEPPAIEMPDLGPVPAAVNTHAPFSFIPTALSIGKQKNPPFALQQVEQQTNILYALFKQTQNGKLHLKEDGEIEVSGVGIDQVSSGTADQIFLSFLLAALDQFSNVTFPLVLDEPFSILAPASQETALELLRGASKRRQIILFTVYPFSPKAADQAVTLSASQSN